MRASEAFVSSRRRPWRTAVSGRAAGLVADVDAGQDLLAGLREGVLVGLVEAEERRDVQALVVLVAERRARASSSGSRSPKVLPSSATMQASSPPAR